MMGQPSALEALEFEWGRRVFVQLQPGPVGGAAPRHPRFLIADTLTGLEHAIQDDYRHHPVSRDCDPPGTADYLNLDDGDVAGDGDVPDEESPQRPSTSRPRLGGGSLSNEPVAQSVYREPGRTRPGGELCD